MMIFPRKDRSMGIAITPFGVVGACPRSIHSGIPGFESGKTGNVVSALSFLYQDQSRYFSLLLRKSRYTL